MNDALGSGVSRQELVALAHETEVECGTGLGDVVPASIGGMDLRWKPGAPGHGEVRTFPMKADLLLAVLGPEVPTRGALRDPGKMAAIKRACGSCVAEFAPGSPLATLLDVGIRCGMEAGREK